MNKLLKVGTALLAALLLLVGCESFTDPWVNGDDPEESSWEQTEDDEWDDEWDDGGDEWEDDGYDETAPLKVYLDVQTNKSVAAPTQKVVEKLTDGKKNYFFVYLGYVENAPIYADNIYLHDGRTAMEYTWTESSSYETSLSEISTTSVEASVSNTISHVQSEKYGANLGVSFKGINAGVSADFTETVSSSLKAGTTYATSSTFSKDVTNRVETRLTKKIDFGKVPAGYYRYTLYADFDVYALVVCDLITGEIDYSYQSFVNKGSYLEGMFYNESKRFDEPCGDDLSLRSESLSDEDLFATDLPTKTDDYVYAEVSDNGNYRSEKTITDAGVYGVEHRSQADTLDLSSLEEYMTDDYVFQFDLVVSARKVYSGHRQIFLYQRMPDYVKDSEEVVDRARAERMGLLESYDFTGAGRESFTFRVSGADCRSTMYVLYDAWGDYEDTWVRESLSFVISVKNA